MKALLATLLLITALLPLAATENEARNALIIGVGDYKDRYFNHLEAPEADAEAMSKKLQSLGFTVTLKLNPTRKEMLDASDAFGTTLARQQGVGLFFFSGHGSMKPDEQDPNFLIPASTRIATREDLPQEAFNAQRVANRMKEAGNRLNLIFMDACRSNTLPSRTKDGSAGLAAMRGPSGLMFFFATQPNQVALEDGQNKRSLFTDALLKHITVPGLSFMDMMADVTQDTEKLSLQNGGTFKQSPFMSGTLSGRFAFVPGTGSAAPQQVARMTTPVDPVLPSPSNPTSVLDQGAVGKSIQVKLPGDVLMKFNYCQAGAFTMGSPASEKERTDEEDQVQVRISKDFWMAQTECSQGQWKALMNDNPSDFKGNNLPVETVSWEDAQEFITKLNRAVSLPSGWKFALPSEAQWEYACRAGTESMFSFGDSPAQLALWANFADKSFTLLGNLRDKTQNDGAGDTTARIGQYRSNAWGIYDMHGNVWEWCQDTCDDKAKLSGGTDPKGLPAGANRVMRGGSWLNVATDCRAGVRGSRGPGFCGNNLGFRPALVPSK